MHMYYFYKNTKKTFFSVKKGKKKSLGENYKKTLD